MGTLHNLSSPFLNTQIAPPQWFGHRKWPICTPKKNMARHRRTYVRISMDVCMTGRSGLSTGKWLGNELGHLDGYPFSVFSALRLNWPRTATVIADCDCDMQMKKKEELLPFNKHILYYKWEVRNTSFVVLSFLLPSLCVCVCVWVQSAPLFAALYFPVLAFLVVWCAKCSSHDQEKKSSKGAACSWANWQTGKQLFVGKTTENNARENTERRVGLAYWRSATTAQEYVFTMYQRDQDKPGSLSKKNIIIETCIWQRERTGGKDGAHSRFYTGDPFPLTYRKKGRKRKESDLASVFQWVRSYVDGWSQGWVSTWMLESCVFFYTPRFIFFVSDIRFRTSDQIENDKEVIKTKWTRVLSPSGPGSMCTPEKPHKDWKYLTRAGYFCHFFLVNPPPLKGKSYTQTHTTLTATPRGRWIGLDWTGQEMADKNNNMRYILYSLNVIYLQQQRTSHIQKKVTSHSRNRLDSIFWILVPKKKKKLCFPHAVVLLLCRQTDRRLSCIQLRRKERHKATIESLPACKHAHSLFRPTSITPITSTSKCCSCGVGLLLCV